MILARADLPAPACEGRTFMLSSLLSLRPLLSSESRSRVVAMRAEAWTWSLCAAKTAMDASTIASVMARLRCSRILGRAVPATKGCRLPLVEPRRSNASPPVKVPLRRSSVPECWHRPIAHLSEHFLVMCPLAAAVVRDQRGPGSVAQSFASLEWSASRRPPPTTESTGNCNVAAPRRRRGSAEGEDACSRLKANGRQRGASTEESLRCACESLATCST
mmetsp:Transcript_60807/g.131938  ORF Transcript_60807/g.131938 Transcript_60807/m.131938 type:complete len:219 (+) Transcript_60807:1662-2318(+)